ncbi:hypothetical protein HOP50_06g41710 [Chloropicon primus]|uniref:Uncharacterized protein n=1 Tax=Chloropicon primus TaxID=1764295 RepID=A0A5B8MNR6_9CHLO|nr:hypothetical protein A3770_06p41620 [Chloropicon primus]UPR00855.1 hypothetical protein HOP50_06g41710 [Chloropicon primus]|eukprot:QDZ21644.1 hypothetical protein A3770_06p41620 [Chloropicon primus]
MSGPGDEEVKGLSGLTLERIEALSFLGAFCATVACLRLFLLQQQRKDLESARTSEQVNRMIEDANKRSTMFRRVVVEPIQVPSPSGNSGLPVFLVQVQVLCLCVGFSCSLLSRRGAFRARAKKGEALGIGAGARRPENFESRQQVWKAITRVNRQLSKTSVKQRITRRALEQQLDTIGTKNAATAEALVEYSKEFKKLQGEVSQVYSVVAGLEGAIRSQLNLINQLVSDEPVPEPVPEPSRENVGEAPKQSEALEGEQGIRGNRLQLAVSSALRRSSSPFHHDEGARAMKPGGQGEGNQGGVRSVEVTQDGQIFHFE